MDTYGAFIFTFHGFLKEGGFSETGSGTLPGFGMKILVRHSGCGRGTRDDGGSKTSYFDIKGLFLPEFRLGIQLLKIKGCFGSLIVNQK